MSAGNKIPNWAREAVEGSDEAFASLVQTFEKSALTYATAILGDEHSGRDAVQEAFLIAYTSLDDLKDSKSFRGWLREIVRRRCLRIIRRKRLVSFAWTDGEESIIDAIDSPAEIYIRNERSAELQKALKSLPKKLREVIDLFHLRHHSQKQVASLIGIPVSTVKNRLHKARLHLKTKIKDMTDHQDSEPIHTKQGSPLEGKIEQCHGAIIEARFSKDAQPDCLDVFRVEDDNGNDMGLAVVQQRLLEDMIRAVRVEPLNEEIETGRLVLTNEEVYDIPEEARTDAIRRLGVEKPETLEFCETGIKPIDLFCPLPKAGNVGLVAPMGTGKLINMEEFHRRLTEAGAEVTLFAFQQLYERDLFHNYRRAIARDARERIDHYYLPRPEKVQAVYLLSQEAFEPGFAKRNLETWPAIIHLTVEQANLGFLPAVCFANSRSSLLCPEVVGEAHYETAVKARQILMEARDLMFDPEWLRLLANRAHRAAAKRYRGFFERRFNELSEEEKFLVRRARRIQRFLTHPYRCAEAFTGQTGRFVSIKDTVSAVGAILGGGIRRHRRDEAALHRRAR